MRVRKCRVETCESSTDRERDRGVTFHKLPKDDALRKKWTIQSRLNQNEIDKNCTICSRHFRRVDFEPFKASVFTLKPDAIPTIFPWGVTRLEDLDSKFSSLENNRTVNSDVATGMGDTKESNTGPSTDDRIDPQPTENGITTPNGETKTDVDVSTENSNAKDDQQTDVKLEKDKNSVVGSESDSKSFIVDRNDLINILSGSEKEDQTCTENIPSSYGEDSQVPEIESIFENLFEKQKCNANEVSSNEVETNESIENYINKTDTREVVGETVKEETEKDSKTPNKTCPKSGGNVGRPRRRSPLIQKNVIRSKTKSLKPKMSISKYMFDEKPNVTKPDKGMLVYGSRVEVKDFSDVWYPARVLEVDHNEMEVLIHYDNWSQRFDEWIYMWSPRIRVVESKPPLNSKPSTYKEGERCFARWSNNQRFPATVLKVLSDGQYEVAFDDGFTRVTKAAMMSKFNTQSNRTSITTEQDIKTKPSKPVNTVSSSKPIPQQNHLFDPNRDHLGTKEERRNLKKKIDVKELFFARKKKKENNQSVDEATKDNNKGRKKKKTEEETPKDAVEKTKFDSSVDKTSCNNNEILRESKPIVNNSSVVTDTTLTSSVPDNSNKSPTVISGKPSSSIVLSDTSSSITNETPKTIASTMSSNSTASPLKMFIKLEKIDIDNISSNIEANQINNGKMVSVKTEAEDVQWPDVKSPISKPLEMISKSVPSNISNLNPQISVAQLNINNVFPKTSIASPNRSHIGLSPVKSPQELITNPANKSISTKFAIRASDRDWCCRWVNNQPVGITIESDSIPGSKSGRITIQVEDHRLPPGWKKLLTKRCSNNATCKWDVILACPSGRRYRTRTEMQERLLEPDAASLEPYCLGLLDFSAHRKQARRRGWDVVSPVTNTVNMVADINNTVNISATKPKKSKPVISTPIIPKINPDLKQPSFHGKDFVFIGSLKVQVIENLLRCPKEGCFKNFRKNNLLQMHIKHYHPEMCKFFGDTPNVADLAYARTVVEGSSTPVCRNQNKNEVDKYYGNSDKSFNDDNLHQNISVYNHQKTQSTDRNTLLRVPCSDLHSNESKYDFADGTSSGNKTDIHDGASFNQTWNSNSVSLSNTHNESDVNYSFASNTPQNIHSSFEDSSNFLNSSGGNVENKKLYNFGMYNFNTSKGSTVKSEVKRSHKKKIVDHSEDVKPKKKKLNNFSDAWDSFNSDQCDIKPNISHMELGIKNEEYQTMIGIENYPIKEEKEESNQSSTIITETGEKIKIVQMKREEIINCHCGFGEEDGLMIQCELCLCWQHALCHNIEKESEVPEKYICLICLQPYRGRKSQKYLHAQDWLYEGRLPRASPGNPAVDIPRANLLRKSHELSANLLQIKDLTHSLRCKMEVAKEKDHPKLYLWSKSWESDLIDNTLDTKVNMIGENTLTSENLMIGRVESEKQKRNMEVDNLDEKDEKLMQMLDQIMVNSDVNNIKNDSESEVLSGNGTLEPSLNNSSLVNGSSGNLFNNLLASPGGTALDIPISNSELESLTKTVQISAPQPEAAIKPSECRVRLLQHIEGIHLALDARLDSIEAQIVELESQDAPLDDDETLTHYPRTKQAIQMILRDLRTLEELGTIS